MLELLDFRKKMIQWAAGGIAVLVLVVAGLLVRGHLLQVERDNIAVEALVAKAQVKAAKEAIDAAEKVVKATANAADLAEADAKKWRVKYEQAVNRVPPPPAPVPTSDPELAAGLVAEGLSAGVQVIPEGITALAHPDAQKALSWALEAKRVPALEEAFSTGRETIKAQDVQIGTLKQETAAQARLADAFRMQGKTQDATISTLGAQVKITEKQVRNQRMQKYVFTFLAGFIGYKAGRR